MWYNGRMKEKLTIVLRWIGAALLPLPVAALVRLFVLCVLPTSICSYIRTDGQWWFFALPYLSSFIEGAMATICTYALAPSSKFFATCIITTVYATISVTCVLIGAFMGTFHMKTAFGVLICLIGMGYGIFNAYKFEHGEEC